MRRLALFSSLAVLIAAAPAGAAKSPASVKLASCRQPDIGAATFRGQMRAVSGTQRMAMRFLLLERMGDSGFERLQAPGLGVWHRSGAGKRGFAYEQKVQNLNQAAAYRALVQFRWYDKNGKLVESMSRRSQVCGPSAPLPNLRVSSLTSVPGSTNGTAVYSVEVSNTGGSAAAGIDLVFRVDGSTVDSARIENIGAGEKRQLKFTGPQCRSRARVLLDPMNSVIESSEADNNRALECAV